MTKEYTRGRPAESYRAARRNFVRKQSADVRANLRRAGKPARGTFRDAWSLVRKHVHRG